MLRDSRSLPDNHIIDTEVCIAGAGAAGITIAREFSNRNFRVSLLESGGFEFDEETQSLNQGEIIGLPYFPLEMARFRCFGGTTNIWSGLCRPLDEIDFEARDWIPHSGWPFGRSHLDPYYERAQPICQLGPFEYNADFWEDNEKRPMLPFIDDRVRTKVFQFSPPTRFGDVYREEISRTRNVDILMHANVVEIEMNEDARTVTRLRVATLEGKTFWVSAKYFILALGGIETPRLLLMSIRAQSEGVGNMNDLVGRFFMEHPHLESGVFLPSDPEIPVDLYRRHFVNGMQIYGALTISEEVLRKEKLLNFSATLSFTKGDRYDEAFESKGARSLRYLYREIHHSKMPDDLWEHLGRIITDIDDVAVTIYGETWKRDLPRFRLFNRVEQAPNPESRVTLSPERDRIGMNRVRLNWQLSSIDKGSVRRAHEIIGKELGLAGIGRLCVELDDSDEWPSLMGGCHLMGTTRMHIDPQKGVVDEKSSVHGTSNLFIAGPSVFPTSGCANPMLTVVALSLRLADHVGGLMKT